MRWPAALVGIQALDSSRGLLRRTREPARGPTVALAIEGLGSKECEELAIPTPWADAVSCGRVGLTASRADINVRVYASDLAKLEGPSHNSEKVPAEWTYHLHSLPTSGLYAGFLAKAPAPPGLPDALRVHPLFELNFTRGVRVVSKDVQAFLDAPHQEIWRGDRMDALLCARQGLSAQALPGTTKAPQAVDPEALPAEPIIAALEADLTLPGSLAFAKNTKPWYERAQQGGGRKAYKLYEEPGAPKDLFWWQLMDGEFMLPGTTCGSFGYSVRSGGVAHVGVEECSPYLQHTLTAYNWAEPLTKRDVTVEDFEELNAVLNCDKHDKKEKDVIKRHDAEVIKELFSNPMQQGQYESSEDAARMDPSVDQLRYGCGPDGTAADPTADNPDREKWCLAPEDKVKLMAQYLEDYYAMKRTLPAPSLRSALQWDAWLDQCATLLTRLHMIHPFRGANSRTRVILLDVLLAQEEMHPALIWNFKTISPVARTIKEGLAAWEASVETGQNAWRFLAHLRRDPDPQLQGKVEGTGPAALPGKAA